MIEESDLIALRRDSGMTDPAPGFEQNFANGKFQAVGGAYSAHYGQFLAVRRPVSPERVFQKGARRSSALRRAGESPTGGTMSHHGGLHGKGQFSRGRDGEQISSWQVKGTRFGAVNLIGKQLQRVAVPFRAIDDRLAVGREARRVDGSSPKT